MEKQPYKHSPPVIFSYYFYLTNRNPPPQNLLKTKKLGGR